MEERRWCGWILAFLQGLLLATAAVILVLQVSLSSSSITSSNSSSTTSGKGRAVVEPPTMTRFSSPLAHPVCGFAPEASPARVYRHLTSSSSHRPAEDLFQISDLKRGIRTRPRLSYWHKILNRIQMANEAQRALNVTILLPATTTSVTSELLERRLEEHMNEWMSKSSSIVGKISTRIQVLDKDPTTSIGPSDMTDVDILVDATGAAMNPVPPLPEIPWDSKTSSWNSQMTPDLANQLRASKQAWIRPFLLQDAAPVLILVEAGWAGTTINGGGGAWSALQTTQSLQELADWYQLPFLSLPSILVPMQYTRPSQYESWIQKYSTDAEDATMGDAAPPLALQGDLLIHLLLLAMLDFTIDVCSAGPIVSTGNLPILKPHAEHLAEYVVPPSLDLSLRLSQISKLWKDEAAKQSKKV